MTKGDKEGKKTLLKMWTKAEDEINTVSRARRAPGQYVGRRNRQARLSVQS